MCENVKKNTEEKRNEKNRKMVENRRLKGEKSPMVAGDLGPWSLATIAAWSSVTLEVWVARFSLNGSFLILFRVSRVPAPVTFQKSEFWGTKLADLHQHLRSAVKSMGSSSDASKSSIGRPKKYALGSTDRKIDRTDVAGPLIAISVRSCMIIRY